MPWKWRRRIDVRVMTEWSGLDPIKIKVKLNPFKLNLFKLNLIWLNIFKFNLFKLILFKLNPF